MQVLTVVFRDCLLGIIRLIKNDCGRSLIRYWLHILESLNFREYSYLWSVCFIPIDLAFGNWANRLKYLLFWYQWMKIKNVCYSKFRFNYLIGETWDLQDTLRIKGSSSLTTLLAKGLIYAFRPFDVFNLIILFLFNYLIGIYCKWSLRLFMLPRFRKFLHHCNPLFPPKNK